MEENYGSFLFKPFDEMTEEDYARVGFKSGLEIHQQLLTSQKLFCRCPAARYGENYDAEILRHMRPTLSELGEYDGTALMEFKTKKEIIYRIKRETVCTYEMDDTPPFLMNEEALDISIGIGMLYDCSIVDEIHIARKQYLDGSIPTGFQRTAIVALNGSIPFKNRKIDVVQLSIEEDSCREVSDVGHQRIYLTDRLGMPLIETVTGPDMRTPSEVAEAAELFSQVVRSTQKVRRGPGAAREDVNVSVKGGTRIEIKGVSKIPAIPLLTYNEAMRQWNLLRLREELHKRGITPDTFKADFGDITKLVRKTHFHILKEAVAKGLLVKCVVLKGFAELLHWKTQTDTYFSREISDRVRVIACLTNIPNIIHSDSKGDTLSSAEWLNIKRFMGATDNDTMVIVWGNEQDSDTAVKEIIIRAKEASVGVPSETRQALHDGTNGFERILPGPDRMYPDTDLPPIRITAEQKEIIRKTLPESIWDRENFLKTLGIPEDTIIPLKISKYAGIFKYAVNELGIKPSLAAVAIIQFPKRLKRDGYRIENLSPGLMRDILQTFKDGAITFEGIYPLMKGVIKLGKIYPELLPVPCTIREMTETAEVCKKEMRKISLKNPEKKKQVLMGLIMEKLRYRIEGSKVAEYIGYEKEGK